MNCFHGLIVTDAQIHAHTPPKRPAVFVKGRKYHSLSFRLSGCITIETEQEYFLSDANTLTFVPAGQAYTTAVPEEGRMLVIHFYTLPCDTPKTIAVFTPSNPDLLKRAFYLLLSDYQTNGSFGHSCMSILYDILSECEAATSERPCIPESIVNAKQRINTDFSDSTLTVAALAEEAGISEVYFRKQFQKHCSVSPCLYLKETRIKNAKLLLKTGFYSVTEIAMRTGFDSPSYFAKEFRKYTGLTPTDYIKKYEE